MIYTQESSTSIGWAAIPLVPAPIDVSHRLRNESDNLIRCDVLAVGCPSIDEGSQLETNDEYSTERHLVMTLLLTALLCSILRASRMVSMCTVKLYIVSGWSAGQPPQRPSRSMPAAIATLGARGRLLGPITILGTPNMCLRWNQPALLTVGL